MNICFYSGDITNPGGTENASIALANLLVERSRGEYNICFLSIVETKPDTSFPLDPRVKRYTLRKKPVGSLLSYIPMIREVSRFVTDHDIDIIIDIDSVLDVISAFACKGKKTKVLSWAHFNFEEELGTFYRRYIKKITVKMSNALIVLTDSDREKYLTQCHPLCPVYTVRNPITAKPQSVKPYSQRDKVILSIGGLVPVKGFDMIPQIAEALMHKHPDWQWLIVGSGVERDNIECLIARHDVEGFVKMTGYMKDIESLYNNASIYVLTSRTEGLPMVLLEARLYGLPVVSYDIGACVRELVTDGECATLIPPWDTALMAKEISALIDNQERRDEMSTKAMDLPIEFSDDEIFTAWSRIITLTMG